MLEIIEIDTQKDAKYSFICLHGLGADGYDFMVTEGKQPLDIPRDLNMRFVFPHAPRRKITAVGAAEMRAWFDITATTIDARNRDDILGMEASAVLIEELIKREIERGIPSNKIVLAGFSQGGVMALYTALRCEYRLGGIVSLSAWLAAEKSIALAKDSVNGGTPIFMGHGMEDMVVPSYRSRESYEHLTKLGYGAKLFTYSMGHSICGRELGDLGQWLRSIVSKDVHG